MKITVTFDSLLEFLQHMNGTQELGAVEGFEKMPEDTPVPFEEAPKAPKTKRKSPEPAEAPQEAPEEPTEAKAPEDLRTEARKVLSLLNKKANTNMAAAMIKKLGVARLTDVQDEDLPGLIAEAREALNA